MGTLTGAGLPEWTDREVTREDFSSSPIFDLKRSEREHINKLLKEHSGKDGMDEVCAEYGK